MAGSRTLTALAGILVSLGLSVGLYLYTGSVLFFLFVPFVPFLFGAGGTGETTESPLRTCSRCQFQTRDPAFEYCPRDGSRLYEDEADGRTDR
jgi:hypothetical protein